MSQLRDTDEPCDAILEDAAHSGSHPPSGWRDVIDNPRLMLAMLFFVTAALGLPLLWISRGFSTRSKVALTFAVLAWTALVLWAFFLVMAWSYGRIASALGH